MQQAQVAIIFDILWRIYRLLRRAPGRPEGIGRQGSGPMRKSRVIPQDTQDKTMDAERINLIGNTLSDLTVRTQELRRYL
ncbi:hypothetical protein [Acidovorax carolinensis]|uniref:hypothetical protein n=1 Tax=Acidovorax carolinensis TaxID=553814 RepID=UPI00194E38F9|nr:hypothetical protein [Acidovorax carolinensis]